MHSPSSLGGRQGVKNFRKVFAGSGGGGGMSEMFILVVGGYIVGG